MNRKEKQSFVEDFARQSQEYSCMLVVRQFGMNAVSTTSLRRALHGAGTGLLVVKNNLVKKALEGTSFPEGFSSSFTGPTGVVLTRDPVTVAKILVDFAKTLDGKLEVFVGVLDGRALSEQDIKTLSTVPPLPQLHMQLLGLLVAPATRLAALLKDAQSRTVRVLQAHYQKNEK